MDYWLALSVLGSWRRGMSGKGHIHNLCPSTTPGMLQGRGPIKHRSQRGLGYSEEHRLLMDYVTRHKRSRSRGDGLSRHNSRSRRSSPTTLGGLVDKAQDKVESFLSPERARDKDDGRRRRHRHEKGSRSLSRGRYSDSDSDDYYRRR